MMSINNNPFKIKENSISNSTANGSNGMVNSTSPNSTSATIKTRTFIPNENILKKASIFNQIGNANSNSNTSLNKTPITKSITKLTNNNGTSNTDLTATSTTVQPLNTPSMIKSPPLAKPKSNGVLTGTNDSNSFNHNSNNNNNNTENSNQTNGSADNSFDATDTSSSDLISTISSVNTKDNSELKTPREKEYDEDEKKIQEKCQQNEESTNHRNKNISSVHVINSSSSSNNNNNNNSENGDQNYGNLIIYLIIIIFLFNLIITTIINITSVILAFHVFITFKFFLYYDNRNQLKNKTKIALVLLYCKNYNLSISLIHNYSSLLKLKCMYTITIIHNFSIFFSSFKEITKHN